MSDVQS